MRDHELGLSMGGRELYGGVVGFGDQAVVVLCIDREHSRALGIEACIGSRQGR